MILRSRNNSAALRYQRALAHERRAKAAAKRAHAASTREFTRWCALYSRETAAMLRVQKPARPVP
jgi:hypothetical protein